MFNANENAGDLYEATHLAEIISVLDPPPAEFLALNPEIAASFWDETGMFAFSVMVISVLCDEMLIIVSPGNWKGIVPIPENVTIESLEGQMGLPLGFVKFLRRTLTWMPDERATAKELLEDPWLKG
jgi:hypothetical protein